MSTLKEMKQNEKKHNRKNRKEYDIDFAWFLRKATSEQKIFVN